MLVGLPTGEGSKDVGRSDASNQCLSHSLVDLGRIGASPRSINNGPGRGRRADAAVHLRLLLREGT